MDLFTLEPILLIGGFFIALIGIGIKVVMLECRHIEMNVQDFMEYLDMEEARRDEECRRIKLSQRGIDEDLHNITDI